MIIVITKLLEWISTGLEWPLAVVLGWPNWTKIHVTGRKINRTVCADVLMPLWYSPSARNGLKFLPSDAMHKRGLYKYKYKYNKNL